MSDTRLDQFEEAMITYEISDEGVGDCGWHWEQVGQLYALVLHRFKSVHGSLATAP